MTAAHAANSDLSISGRCLCGDVRFRVRGDVRDIVVCHCGQCRANHGSAAAYSACRRDRLMLDSPASIRWYQSSIHVQRGFCGRCGSSLFWDDRKRSYVAVAATALSENTDLRIQAHIYTGARPAYDEITDCHPQFSASMEGA